jgi:hypothetical protein
VAVGNTEMAGKWMVIPNKRLRKSNNSMLAEGYYYDVCATYFWTQKN